MAINLEKVSERIFQILKGYNLKLYLFDNNGDRVYDYKKSTRFFAEPLNLMVMIETEDRGKLKVFVSQSLNITEHRKLIDSLKQTAGYYNMDYSIRQYGKELSPKDFAHLNESSLFGTTKSSYQKIGEVKLILRHSDKIDETKRGARSRRIREAFIEDAQGQRFKLPTTWLNGNRAICKYIAEGGDYYGDTGITLRRLTEEYAGLKTLFRYSKNLKEQNNFSKNLLVNVYERLHTINETIRDLNKEALFEETLERVNSISVKVLNETDLTGRIVEAMEHLNINPEDVKMKNILENAIEMGLGEARKKKTVDFEVTPEIQAWAKFLKKMDAYSGDNIDRSAGEEGEEISEVDFLNQAKRIVNKEVKAFPGAKAIKDIPAVSNDPEVAHNQNMLQFYSVVAQKVNPVDDVIVGNIISRLADHYEYLLNNSVPVMSENSGIFKSIQKMADAVAKMVGVDKAQFESVQNPDAPLSSMNELAEWFKRFDINTIINEEKKKKMVEKKKEMEKKIKAVKESRISKAKNIMEDQEKFFSLASKLALIHSDTARVKSLTKILSESQKKRLLRVMESTWEGPVVKDVASAMGVQSKLTEYDKSEVQTRRQRWAKMVIEKAGEIRGAAKKVETSADTKQQAQFAQQYKDSLVEVFQLLDNLGFGKLKAKVQELIRSANTLIRGDEYSGNFANEVVNTLYDNVMQPIEKALNKPEVEEAKDGRKATSAMGSSDKMADRMDRIGSPRQFALDKARSFVAKGISPKEALERNNLPVNRENLEYVKGGNEMKDRAAGDKYAQMAAKRGIKEQTITENYIVFSGSVRNKEMFIEAVEKERGYSVAEAVKNILEQKPFQTVDKDILEVIKEYAKIKREDELAEAIDSYLVNPLAQEKTQAEMGNVLEQKIRVVSEGFFNGMTGSVIKENGIYVTVKLDDVIDPVVLIKDEVVKAGK